MGPAAGDPSAANSRPDQQAVDVAWWLRSSAAQVPAVHQIGWERLSSRQGGTFTLAYRHPHPPSAVIEAELHRQLQLAVANFHRAADVIDRLSPTARLAAAGHDIRGADLAFRFGLTAVGGVVAERRVRRVHGTVFLDRHLSDPVRDAVAHWAAEALEAFDAASPADLETDGWRPFANSRWQLIARQP